MDLAAEGFAVSASVSAWPPPLVRRGFANTERIFHQEILNLIERGVDVRIRPKPYPLRKRAWRALIAPEKSPTTIEVERLVAARSPDFVVISDGAPFPPLDLLEMCVTKRLPFVILVQCNQYSW
ncbi:MAG: hypothetical protein WCA23_23425, partial [Stellaceae bacterium]